MKKIKLSTKAVLSLGLSADYSVCPQWALP